MASNLAKKKGLILGVANDRSIATHIAARLHQEGAQLGFSYLPDDTGKMEGRVRKALGDVSMDFLLPCNVDSDASLQEFFRQAQEKMGTVDFVVHSIAFAPLEDIRCRTVDASRAGFHKAMETSVYSFLRVCHHAEALLNPQGAVLTLSYLGAERVMPGYNLMGVAKAGLEAAVRYAAYDLGKKQIRVNAISSGPLKTLAASAVGNFSQMLSRGANAAPLGRNTAHEDVANAAEFLLSPLSSGVTGEVLHVDCGFNIMSAVATDN